MMITQELENNINFACTDARRRGLEIITVEHLALVLIQENSSVREMLVDCQADISGLKSTLSHFLASRVPATNIPNTEPKPSEGFHRVLKRAMVQAEQKGDNLKINGIHVLAAIFAEPESYAAYYLQKHGIERLNVIARLNGRRHRQEAAKLIKEKKSDYDLVAAAVAGEIEKPFGRETELLSLIQVMSRKYKNNPILVGEPGVGKTVLIHGLAHRIAAGQVPDNMINLRITSVSVADLVAGTKYRGDFEQRVQRLAEQCRQHGNTAVFIDEIHTLIGTGAVSGGALDAANILKSLLNEEGIRYIGATTFAEYRRLFEKDGALSRRFQKIEVREPDEDALLLILDGIIKRLAAHHSVHYEKDAAKTAIELSRRYLRNHALPDKAIDLLDDAGAARHTSALSHLPIGRKDLTRVAMLAVGLPVDQENAKTTDFSQLEQCLSSAVFDQEEAAQRLTYAVLRGHLGYHDGSKTIGAFLFVGPTGVGKTEMARQLALTLTAPLLRYDMSEYMEPHAVSRLIGAPPGYIGYEHSGKLVEDIFSHPNAVVLFDEVEKAHPHILNILLQILDYGTLTDNIGRTANFTNAIVILTSNLGAAEIERGVSGYDRDDHADLGEEAVNRYFLPELRNRLDAVIRFKPLSQQTVERITDARLAELSQHLAEKKNLLITVGTKLRKMLKKEGFSATMGARPLQRLLAENILEPLALAEAKAELPTSRRIRLDVTDGNKIVISPSRVRRRIRQPA